MPNDDVDTQRIVTVGRVPSGPVVVFDIDNVVADFIGTMFDWLRETYGIEHDDDYGYYFIEDVIDEHGFDVSGAELYDEFVADGGLTRLRPIYPALDAVLEASRRWPVVLATARPGDSRHMSATLSWLRKWSVPYDMLVFVGGGDSATESTRVSKATALGDLLGDVDRILLAVDDAPGEVVDYCAAGVDVACPDLPYTDEIEVPDDAPGRFIVYSDPRRLIDIVEEL